jgi:PAS domain S-box-containing protein
MIRRPDLTSPNARVLVVDDEFDNREILRVMLTSNGLQVETAVNGEDALAMIAASPPDIVLLDIMMPGIDGYQVTASLKGNPETTHIPIILVTALSDQNARMAGLLAGAEDFLTKPLDRAELTLRVRNLLRLKAYGDYHDQYSQILEAEVGSRTAELVESERLYRSTFDAAPVGIIHVGLHGEWLRVNQRLCDLLGYDCDELQGPGARIVLESDTHSDEVESLRQMMAGTLDRYVVEEKRFRKKSGEFVLARVNMSVHRGADGTAQHFIGVIEDITERRTLEAQIRQATKMDAVGRLASGVAHDFNNLLTVILGFAELVRLDETISSMHERELSEIVNAAKSAAGLTRQLLAFGRQQVLNDAPLDLNALIREMAGMLGRLIGEHIEVVLELDPVLCPALADRNQVEQVVMNLVVNARDAMPLGGRIIIETAEIDLENSAFHDETIVPGRYVMLAVTDNGAGMSYETQRQIFEPFYTTKGVGMGTGLGLSTTYGVVKQSNGYIWVYSEVGRGTTFKVFLPLAQAGQQTPSVARTSVPVPVRGTGTVLLVEDAPGVRKLSKRILADAGYHVLDAADGDSATLLFREHANDIDLVVTDVVMPGCGGPALYERLKQLAPDLRVLYMSGYPRQSTVHTMGIDSDAPFVQKPFTAAELAAQVGAALTG